jgi:hypothetical protein
MSKQKLVTIVLLVALLVSCLSAAALGAAGIQGGGAGRHAMVIADGETASTPTPTPVGDRPTCGGSGGSCS